MAIVMHGHNIIEFKDLQKIIQDLQETIKEYYVRKEDLQKMSTEILLSKEQIEGLVKDVIKDVIAKDYVTREQYEKDMKALRDELTSSEVISEREIYRSPVYKSIESAQKEPPKKELTEFTQADLDAYESKAFGGPVRHSANTPSIEACRNTWDELHNSLRNKSGGNNGKD